MNCWGALRCGVFLCFQTKKISAEYTTPPTIRAASAMHASLVQNSLFFSFFVSFLDSFAMVFSLFKFQLHFFDILLGKQCACGGKLYFFIAASVLVFVAKVDEGALYLVSLFHVH